MAAPTAAPPFLAFEIPTNFYASSPLDIDETRTVQVGNPSLFPTSLVHIFIRVTDRCALNALENFSELHSHSKEETKSLNFNLRLCMHGRFKFYWCRFSAEYTDKCAEFMGSLSLKLLKSRYSLIFSEEKEKPRYLHVPEAPHIRFLTTF